MTLKERIEALAKLPVTTKPAPSVEEARRLRDKAQEHTQRALIEHNEAERHYDGSGAWDLQHFRLAHKWELHNLGRCEQKLRQAIEANRE